MTKIKNPIKFMHHKCVCGHMWKHSHLASSNKEYWGMHICTQCGTPVTDVDKET